MEIYKDKQLSRLRKLCDARSVTQKMILDCLKQIPDLNYSVKLITSKYAGFTPLHFLMIITNMNESEIITLIKWLIDHGADINAQTAIGSTVIHIAAEYNKKTILDFLFSNEKVHMNVINKKGISYLHIACMMSDAKIAEKILNSTNTEMIDYQINNLSNFNMLDKVALHQFYHGGETALHIAVQNNSLDIVQLLIGHKADLQKKDNNGLTPLCYAARNKYLNIKRVLQGAISKMPNLRENLESNTNLSHKVMRVINSPVTIKGFSDLHYMCMENNVLEVKKLLIQKVDVNESICRDSPSWSGYTALHIVVKQGNLKLAQLLLNNGADVNVKDERGETPLHLAVENNRWDIVLSLINRGADLWTKNIEEMTPLHIALRKYEFVGQTKIQNIINLYTAVFHLKHENLVDDLGISLLHIACIINNLFMVIHFLQNVVMVNSCINCNSPLFPGYTPLHLAVQFENSEVVKILLDNGADYTLMNAKGFTAVHLAEIMDNSEIIKVIFSSCYFRADNPISSTSCISHFHIACKRNRMEAVEKYIEHNIDINQPIDFFADKLSGCTPLHLAIDKSHTEIVKLLLNHKDIQITAVDSDGSSPVHHACLSEDPKPEILEMLLERKADPNVQDFFGNQRPVEIVIKRNNETLLEILLKYKADVNFNAVNKFNPLYAVINSMKNDFLNSQMLKLLLNNGADITVEDKRGLSLIHKILNKTPISCSNYVKEPISLLWSKGCDIDYQDEKGSTPLHTSIQECRMDIALILLQNGVNINVTDDSGKIPIEYYKLYYLYYDSSCRDFDKYLMNHIFKLKMSKSYIHPKNHEWYLKTEKLYVKNKDEYSYETKLLKELETMKQHKLSKYTTLYDVLQKTPNAMAFLVENKLLKKMIHSNLDLTTMFPEYSCLLLAKYNKGLMWKRLSNAAKDAFKELLCEFELPDECFEEIFKYLTSDNLRSIIRSSCKS